MSLWHIPVHELVPRDPFLNDMLEITFPPLRYYPLFNDRSNTRGISRELDRLYKDVLEPLSYISRLKGNTAAKPDGFVVNLDVKHFKPEEVSLKVEGIIWILSFCRSNLKLCTS